MIGSNFSMRNPSGIFDHERRQNFGVSGWALTNRFFRWWQADWRIDTAHVHIPLGKGNLDSRCPETAINLVMQGTPYLYAVVEIGDKDTQFEVQRTLPEI